MAEKDDNSTQAPSQRFAHLNGLHLGGIERSIAKGDYVSAEDLAATLRKHGSRPIPPSVLDYLCRLLEGKVAKPKGRDALPELDKRRRRWKLRNFYQRNLTWLQGRKARYGHLDGWPAIREADFWKGPLNEIATRMVARRVGYGAESWRRVQNDISSRK